jgi:hypothetical protein
MGHAPVPTKKSEGVASHLNESDLSTFNNVKVQYSNLSASKIMPTFILYLIYCFYFTRPLCYVDIHMLVP